MTHRGSRLARGWIAAFFATFAAAGSHVIGGGEHPPFVLILLTLALAAPICVALAGRLLSIGRLVFAVLASQSLFHLIFSMASGSPSSMPVSALTSGHHAGMEAGLLTGVTPSSSLQSAAHGMMHAGTHDAGMWLGHCAAALLTIVFLRHAESSCIQLLTAIRLRVSLILSAILPKVDAPRQIVPPSANHQQALTALRIPLPVRHHRGPPQLRFAA